MERSDEFVKGRSSIYRKILRYYLPFIYNSTLTITPTHTPTNITISPTIIIITITIL
jgi:hypothetical protein